MQQERVNQSDSPGSISGKVTLADTGTALSKSLVTIEHVGVYPSDPRVTRTGLDGAFQFTNVVGGTYTITASHIGFVAREYGLEKIKSGGIVAMWIHVEAGQSLNGINFSLPACTSSQCPPSRSESAAEVLCLHHEVMHRIAVTMRPL